jgi:hypothetical protein
MKKIYLMAFTALFASAAMAQVDVTFQVDMNDETVSPNGVHVAGDWQDGMPGADTDNGDWDPSTDEMTDTNGDGIYTLDVQLPPGNYAYKYINDNAWGSDEAIPEIARIGNDRGFAITSFHETDGFELPAVKFAGAAPEGMIPVRLEINMSQQDISENGVHVAGDLIEPNWEPGYGTASPVGAGIYAYITYVTDVGTYSYKFINDNNWGADEWAGQTAPAACTEGGNRTIEVDADGVSSPAYCFESCETCADPNVSLTVDMSLVDTDNGGYIAGSFNGYTGEAMTDNGDGTYTAELSLEPGDYQFKFQNGPGGWESVPLACRAEGSENRGFTVIAEEDFTLVRCFAQCTEACVENPDPADITFRVDMSAETVAAEGVFLIGNFTEPVWQDGPLEMTDADGDDVYEATSTVSGSAEILFKYVNGVVNADMPENEEFHGDSMALACNVPNDFDGYNRIHTRSGETEILDVVPFGACGTVGIEEIELGSVSIFPNPTSGNSYIDIENPNGYTLRMNIVDITGKTVRENTVINSTRYEINTNNLNSGLYFLNIVNERNNHAAYKLMVQ